MSSKKKIPAKVRATVLRRDGAFRCVYCIFGRTSRNGQPYRATCDHVRPEARGGATVENNLVKCCQRCNDDKHVMPLHLWVRMLEEDTGLDPDETTLRTYQQMFANEET
ncbi:MAG: HNH endonuclease [Polyangiaceae bacterium]|jgi:5-methylcytosine-specific restriction endonuclease McrA|nr:HNH endonuclease [Polyangiaceae bacterium]